MRPSPLVQCAFGLGCTSLSQLWALEITLGAASFPRGSFYKNIYICKQSQVSVQLSFVDLQGPIEAAAMETVQLSSHSHLPPRSVSRRGSSVPLIESVYHSFNFLLSVGRWGGEGGEHFFMECQSGDDHNSCTSLWWKMLPVLHCGGKCFIWLSELQFLISN